MVIAYRNKFLKVFGLFVVSVLVPLLYVRALIKALNSGNYEGFLFNSSITFFLIMPLILAAIIFYYWSCYLLVKAKGYSGWYTLIGLIKVFGFAILCLLPDKRKNNPPEGTYGYKTASVKNQIPSQQSETQSNNT
ncbi:hypothetical protein HYS95_02855 [Candidatus Daviesbacteria bacterium]|nr:hypothetical protein [Candidatus Daviesbacteria bacterium]